MSRKFYKTVITVTVLCDEPVRGYPFNNLESVACRMDDGDCCGQVVFAEPVELSPVEAVLALAEQGSEPSFFGLNDDGTDAEEGTP